MIFLTIHLTTLLNISLASFSFKNSSIFIKPNVCFVLFVLLLLLARSKKNLLHTWCITLSINHLLSFTIYTIYTQYKNTILKFTFFILIFKFILIFSMDLSTILLWQLSIPKYSESVLFCNYYFLCLLHNKRLKMRANLKYS